MPPEDEGIRIIVVVSPDGRIVVGTAPEIDAGSLLAVLRSVEDIITREVVSAILNRVGQVGKQ